MNANQNISFKHFFLLAKVDELGVRSSMNRFWSIRMILSKFVNPPQSLVREKIMLRSPQKKDLALFLIHKKHAPSRLWQVSIFQEHYFGWQTSKKTNSHMFDTFRKNKKTKKRSEAVGFWCFSSQAPPGGVVVVLAAIFHVNLRATRVLNGDGRGHLVEICIGNQWIVSLQIIPTFPISDQNSVTSIFSSVPNNRKGLFPNSSNMCFKMLHRNTWINDIYIGSYPVIPALKGSMYFTALSKPLHFKRAIRIHLLTFKFRLLCSHHIICTERTKAIHLYVFILYYTFGVLIYLIMYTGICACVSSC